MALLTLRDVHKSYSDRELLSGASLVLEPRERVGLLGPNGCGKSTLLRIAAGIEEVDTGERVTRRGLTLGYLEQEPRLLPEATLRQAVTAGLGGRDGVLARLEQLHVEVAASDDAASVRKLLEEQAALEDRLTHLGGYDIEHRVEALLTGLGLGDPERTCEQLSGGESRRVALARLLLGEPELLLLDEPTNHLDVQAIDWLEDYLLASRAALLMITHDRYVLDRVVHRIVEIDRGDLFSYVGGYGDYLVARAEREASEGRVESSRLNLLRRETAWMRRGPPARSTKAKARKDRYAELVDGAPERAGGQLEFSIPPGPRLGTRVLTVTGLGKAYDGRVILDGLDLELGPGERLGIIGPNGAGKTTLLRLLTGEQSPDEGSVSVGETVTFASIDQRRSDLDPAKTVVEEIAGRGANVRVGEEVRRVEGFLEQFLFPGSQKHALIGTLSGGERNRVLLAKLLCAGGNVLLLDEPTNDLDLMTLRALEEALIAFEGAVLVVSHDRYFLDRVATRVLALDGRGGARLDACSVSDLLQRLAQASAALEAQERAAARAGVRAAVAVGAAPDASERTTPGPASKRLSNWEQAEYDGLLDRITAAEAALAELDTRLADPALYQGPADTLRSLQAERDAAARDVAELTERWEALAERAG